MKMILMTCLMFFLSSCTRSTPTPVPAPAVTPDHAAMILKYEGWEITEHSEEPKDSGQGCVAAKKTNLSGRVCFKDCNGRSVAEIAKQVGPSYAYQVGDASKCNFYTVFEGSPEFRKTVASNLDSYVPKQ